MKIAITLVGCAAAGLIGALAGIALTGNSAAPAAPTKGAPSEVDAKLGEISQQIASLSERIRTLEVAPPLSSAPMSDAVASRPVTSSEDPTAAATPAEEEALEEKVREIVNERQKAQWETMGRGFMAMAKQRESAMVQRLAENHGLAPYQAVQLEALLERRRSAIAEFFRGMMSPEEGADPVDVARIREKITEVQEKTDEEIQNLLSPDQYAAFQADPANQRGGGPPWGGGGGLGGSGPGGGRTLPQGGGR